MQFRGPTGWIGLIALVFFIGFAVKQNLDRDRAAHWPAASGTVIAARLIDSHRTNVDRDHGLLTASNGARYRLLLTYAYDVNGRSFTGTRLGFDTTTSSLDMAQRLLEKHAKGSTLEVHYNPASPEDAMAMR